MWVQELDHVAPYCPPAGVAPAKNRVLLADDHPGLLAAVRSLLKTDMDVIASVGDGECLFEASMKLQPDIIVTDISMPKLSGAQGAHRLRESGCPSRIVFLTVHTDADVIRAALRNGCVWIRRQDVTYHRALVGHPRGFSGANFRILRDLSRAIRAGVQSPEVIGP